MPIYEYACDSCGNQFEVKQKFSDPPVTECEKCGELVRKLISVPGIVFKGTGWYVTDYSDKLKDPKKSVADGAGAEKKTEKKEAASTESSVPSNGGDSNSTATSKSEASSSSSSSSTTSSSPSSSKPSSSTTSSNS